MTIETDLGRIATALEVIARNGTAAASADTQAPTAAPTAPRPRGRPPKVQAEPAPAAPTEAELPEEEPEADNFLDVAEAAPVYTIEQVREAIVGYQKKTGDPEKARKLLKTVGGVDTLRSLPEDKFGAIIEACKK